MSSPVKSMLGFSLYWNSLNFIVSSPLILEHVSLSSPVLGSSSWLPAPSSSPCTSSSSSHSALLFFLDSSAFFLHSLSHLDTILIPSPSLHITFLSRCALPSSMILSASLLYLLILANMSSDETASYGSVLALFTDSKRSDTLLLKPLVLLLHPVTTGLVFFPSLWSLNMRYRSASCSEETTLLSMILSLCL